MEALLVVAFACLALRYFEWVIPHMPPPPRPSFRALAARNPTPYSSDGEWQALPYAADDFTVVLDSAR